MRSCTLDGIKIDGICACVPSHTVDNTTFGAELFGDRIEDTIRVTGIRTRRVCPPGSGITALDLCIEAAKKLLEHHTLISSDLGGVLFVTQTPDHDIPNNSSRAADLLGLSHSCTAVDTSFGCSGYVYGLWLAGLMAKSLNAPVLLLDGETHSYFTSPRDRATALLFGDAGSATILTPDEGADPWFFGFLTDGSKHDVLLVPEGRSRNLFNEHSLEYRNWPDGGVRRPIDIRMDGMAVFNFVVRNVPPVLTEVLKNAGVPADAVDRLLLHQANLFMIEQVAKQVGIPRDRMPVSLDRYGNSSSATLPVTICSELAGELQTERKRALLAGFGAGLSIAAASIEMGPCICPGLLEYPGE